ncbi:DUF924 family protein [Marivita sp. GX14005]|uniref:DUF924 family protein n=1 Tax=Marivita sp. GX14005 TaxID=2942276 RepID=UPI0020198570|nr:DUF924 family protein [Marivita sp. GX14005]MCL3882460.1 DUF924 domain-containing protein [Marivita sp. GX14005]
MVTPEKIIEFWLDDVGPKGWYEQSAKLDRTIKDRFEEDWNDAVKGRHDCWLADYTGSLAYIILLDQFPRNMFRGSAKAFSSDRLALAAAKAAISKDWDLKVEEPGRQFFYMPLMHSENLCDQDRCVRLMLQRMPKAGANNLLHARAHREIIRRFGRFPYRNEALSRNFTSAERRYVDEEGYGETVRQMQGEPLRKAG